MKLSVKVVSLVLSIMMILGVCASAETLIVGTNPEFPPFEFVGDDGNVTGIDVDIMNAICKEIGYDCQIESMDFDALIPALASGKIDASIAGMTATEERKKSVLFSDPYYQASQSIIVPAEGATVAAEADLSGKKIGVQLGTTGDIYVTEAFPDATIERYNKGVDAVQDLVNGRLDAVVIDEAPAKVFVAQTQGLTILPDRLSDEVYAIAMPMDATELQGKINEALTKLTDDGTLAAIIDSYNTEE